MTRFIYLLICLIEYASTEPFNCTRLLAPVKRKERLGRWLGPGGRGQLCATQAGGTHVKAEGGRVCSCNPGCKGIKTGQSPEHTNQPGYMISAPQE